MIARVLLASALVAASPSQEKTSVDGTRVRLEVPPGYSPATGFKGVINVLLNLTFIPIYGLYGAAWATTVTMMFEATALYAVTLRHLGIHMFIFGNSGSPVAGSSNSGA